MITRIKLMSENQISVPLINTISISNIFFSPRSLISTSIKRKFVLNPYSRWTAIYCRNRRYSLVLTIIYSWRFVKVGGAGINEISYKNGKKEETEKFYIIE
jgi:hypothetical protein